MATGRQLDYVLQDRGNGYQYRDGYIVPASSDPHVCIKRAILHITDQLVRSSPDDLLGERSDPATAI